MKPRLAFFQQHVLPAVLCFGAALWLTQTNLLHRVENVTLDERTKLRSSWNSAVASDAMALVGIDEESMHEFKRWPWPRDYHGDFMQLLGQRAPGVVGWDILFTEPGPEDAHFARSLKTASAPVVLGSMLVDEEDGIKPTAEQAAAAGLAALPRIEGDVGRVYGGPAMLLPTPELAGPTLNGFVDTPPEPDGVRRMVPLVVRVGERVYPSFSLRCLMAYWRAKPEDVVVRLGDVVEINAPLAKRRIPIDEAGRYQINYRHKTQDFTTYGYFRAFAELKARYDGKVGRIPLVTGRILLIGQVAEGLTDLGPTPFSPLTALVLVHANAIDNILNEDYTRRAPEYLIWLGALGFGLLGLVVFSERKLRDQAIFAIGVPLAYLAASILLWIDGSWMLPWVGPLLGFGLLQVYMIGRRVVVEQRAKEQIKGMFGSYVSPELVDRMVELREMPRLGGHDEEITAYFSDIQDFSTFAEILPPERLVDLMNEYLSECTDIVQAEGGTLDKYIGDAVVAMFGAPIPLPDHAYRACLATQRVQARLAGLREKWRGESGKWPDLVWRMQSRIGLNSGRVVVGNMGSTRRFNYTMMGDNVNVAARMESGAKEWGVYVMCTETTKLDCEKFGGDRIVFRPLGRVRVKGRSVAVPIHEIVGLKDSLATQTGECISLFSQGLERYYERDWAGARKLFERSSLLEPNAPGVTPGVTRNPSVVYLDITAQYLVQPPPRSWDGVYVMKDK